VIFDGEPIMINFIVELINHPDGRVLTRSTRVLEVWSSNIGLAKI